LIFDNKLCTLLNGVIGDYSAGFNTYISSLLPVLLKKYQFKARDQALCKLFFIIFALQFDKGGIEFAYPSLSLIISLLRCRSDREIKNAGLETGRK
jgi:hypothetical protein